MNNFFKGTLNFMKRNVYYILLALCIAAIVTVVVVGVNAQNKPSIPVNNNNNNNNNNPDPDPPGPVVIVFDAPVKIGTIGMDYSDSIFVYNDTLRRYQIHKAIDFIADAGTPVYAVYDGVVDSLSYDDLFGTTIKIRHDDNLYSVYKSLQQDVTIKVGDRLRKGDEIGKVGLAFFEVMEGPHLHFEVMKGDKVINPYDYLLESEK